MALSKTKLPLLSFSTAALFLILLATKVHSQSQEHVDFQFNEFPEETDELTYQGDAHVPPGSTYLRLIKTNSNGYPASGSVGRVLYSTPIKFWEPGRQSTFETTIKFFITTVNNNPADGIVFFIAPANSTIPNGSGGGSLGIFSSAGTAPNVFAVEFDVYVNAAWDPDYRHIGIDIESRKSRSDTTFENALNQEVTARINYNPNTRQVTVNTKVGSQTFDELSYEVDLKSILHQQVQVGISASTGQDVAVFDVLSWYYSSTLVSDQYRLNNQNLNSRKIGDKYIRQCV